MNKLVCITIALALWDLAPPAVAQSINEDIKIAASDPAAFDLFGFSVAIDQGVMAVGAYQDDDGGNESGSVYLFDANPASVTFGTQLNKLTAKDTSAGDLFGWSVAINQGIVAVGAPSDDDIGSDSGSVYLFDADPTSLTFGMQLDKLTAGDAAGGDEFGFSVAIDQGVVVVGAYRDSDSGLYSGSVYLYDADRAAPTFGTQLNKLTSSDAAAGDLFGWSVAINQGIVVVGAHSDDDGGSDSGSAYLFDGDRASPTFGTQLSKILANDASAKDLFGFSVAIDHEIVAIGAHNDDDGSVFSSGSVYLFDADPSSQTFGRQLRKLTASDAAGGEWFGYSIAIDHGIVVAGAIRDDDGGAIQALSTFSLLILIHLSSVHRLANSQQAMLRHKIHLVFPLRSIKGSWLSVHTVTMMAGVPPALRTFLMSIVHQISMGISSWTISMSPSL